MSEKVSLGVELLAVLENSLKVTDGDRECFIPRSVLPDNGREFDSYNEGDTVEIEIPVWLASDRGLI